MTSEEIIFTTIAWTIIIGFLWGAIWFFMAVRDNRPKEGLRCRSCLYQLQGLTSNHCPECGADLLQTGAWRPGQPCRSGIIHIAALTAWLVYVPIALFIQWLATNQELLPLSFQAAEYIMITLILSGWLIPVAVALVLRRRRNRLGTVKWDPSRDQSAGQTP